MPGVYLLTDTNFIPIRGVMKKFLFGHTHKHTRTRNESAVDRQGPAPALART